MIKKLLLVCIVILLTASCGGPTADGVLADRFRKDRPYTVAVLPVEWTSDAPEKRKAISHFRTLSSEKLLAMGYRLVPLEAVDALNLNNGANALTEKQMTEAAEKLDADGLVLIRVVNWDIVRFSSYASLNIEADFSIYSKKGELIWNSSYKTSESDSSFELDAEPVDLGVVKVYEPRILRFVEAVFATLPHAEKPGNDNTFFDWLP